MSYTAKELLKLASDYNNVATRALFVMAEKKEKKKLDPKAKNKKILKKKKKKASEYYDVLLSKLGQAEPQAPKGTPGNPWKEGELGETVELDDPPAEGEGAGTGTRQPISFQRNNTRPRFEAIPPEVQEALDKLGYKGPKGESVVKPDRKGDGQLGPITRSVLDQYRAKNKDRAVDTRGNPISQELMYEMIKRDASGENKTTTFDHKTTNDSLNTVSAYLTQLQAWQGQKQILPKNVEQIKQQLAQYATSVGPAMKAINDALADERSSQQEKQLAQQLAAKAKKLNDDIAAWNKFLATVPKPMTDDKPYG